MNTPAQVRSIRVFVRALIIAALVFWIYTPAFHGRWLGDDEMLVPGNNIVCAPDGLWKIWFNPANSLVDYQPVKFTISWLQWRLWGDDTLGYHLTNVALHILSCLLIWRLLNRLGLRWAWLGGVLFAVHPVLVESVAWLAELKNTLSLPPLLLAMLCWIDFVEKRRARDYLLALSFFSIAMLCKATPVMFPVILLLYSWWKTSRIDAGYLKAVSPFFTVSLFLGLVTIWFLHHHAIGSQSVDMGSLLSRLALCGLTTTFYFLKSVFPVGLMPIYPRWVIDPPSALQFLPLLILAAVIIWLWTHRTGWGRHALFGLGFFLINLVPFTGILTGSYMLFSWVNDHTLYIPIIGLIGLIVAALEVSYDHLPSPARTGEIVLIAAVTLVLAVESHSYARIYRDKETIYRFTVAQNPAAVPGRNGLALLLLTDGRLDEALQHVNASLQVQPDFAESHALLGEVYFKRGQLTDAEAQYRIALKLEPDNALVLNSLGAYLAQAGYFPEALDSYNHALAIQPGLAEALAGRGEIKRIQADLAGALTDLDQALAIKPELSSALLSRGVIRMAQGDSNEAIHDFRKFLDDVPQDRNAHYVRLWLWIVRTDLGQREDADLEFTRVGHAWTVNASAAIDLYSRGQTVGPGGATPAQLCERAFYTGIKRRLAGDRPGAIEAFRACLATHEPKQFESTLAQGELQSLTK